ncbi:amino acid adenylation domain-containing protein [Paenibacillus sp. FSL H8-0283]|uniref:amino acid adenylation domain-containing protein n=1 Tax=Paenibacillus sp. FSL H8-0283 TaxID=2921383 RepID=UPI0032464435
MLLYPLSHPQKRVWIIENIYSKSSLYNLGGAFYFKQAMDLTLLKDSIKELIDNNANLRIRLKRSSNNVYQYVDETEHEVSFIDFREMQIDSETWFTNHFNEPFELIESSLFCFIVFIDQSGNAGCYFKVHHLIGDGWSVKLIAESVVDIYQSKFSGKEVKSDQLLFTDYLHREEKYKNSSRFLKDKTFWTKRFEDLTKVAQTKSSENTQARRLTTIIDANRSNSIKNYIQNQAITNAAFFTGVLFLHLSKMDKTEELILGTPVFNRSGRKERASFGMYTSTMPLKMNIDPEIQNSTFMIQAHKELNDCYFHQKYPYDILIEDILLKQQGKDQLFQHCINYSNAALPEHCDGIDIKTLDFFSGHQIYSLQVFVKDWYQDGHIRLDFEYKTDDYTDAQIQHFSSVYLYLIEQIILDNGAKVKDLRIMEPELEKEIIHQWNDTEDHQIEGNSIVELFYKQAALHPGRIALEYGETRLTYEELNLKSNALARNLSRYGIGSEKVVAIISEHSLEAIIAIWAVLKAGAAFLPIDPKLPSKRKRYMLEDSNVSAILTNLGGIDEYCNNINVIDISLETTYEGTTTNNLTVIPAKNQLAYIIYTSGSTGIPKGVMVEHGGLFNYTTWACSTYVDEIEVFPVYSSFSFDLTLTSIFTPLICGSKAVIYSESNSGFVLDKVITDNQSTVIKLTPSHLRLLIEHGRYGNSLRTLIVGGEDLKVQLAENVLEMFGQDINIFNEYGPTETVVGCMIYRYDSATVRGGSVSIGKPIQNTQIYILDGELQPVPLYTKGEMFVSGAGVARGYLNQGDLTNEKFLPNPFVLGQRMYKTGDIGYYVEDGNLFYVGRADDQVKINGYRIEVLEIENIMCGLEGVKEAVVTKHSLPNGSDMLIAHLELLESISTNQLKRSLSLLLPSYMIPSHFEIMERLPVTTNGKINRSQLPMPKLSQGVENRSGPSEIAKQVLSALEEILKTENISLDDNFFFIGGDSIKAIQVSSLLNTQGIELKAKDILLFPIVGEHAEMAEKRVTEQTTQPAQCKGSIPPSPINQWFLKGSISNKDYYLQSVHINLKEDISYNQFCHAISQLVDVHDSLRITMDKETMQLKYQDVFPLTSVMKYMDIRLEEEGDYLESMIKYDKEIKESISMDSPSLFYCVFYDTPHGIKVSFIAHHLIVDGISWRILLEDLDSLIREGEQSHISRISKGSSYQEWAGKLLEYAESPAARKDREYWSKVVSRIHYIDLKDKLQTERSHSPSVQEQRIVQESITKLIMSTVNKNLQTTSKDLIVAAVVLSIWELTKESNISVMLEGHGREMFDHTLDINRTVGWFTSLFPVNFFVESGDLTDQIIAISNELNSIPLNGMGYGIHYYLKDVLGVEERRLVRLNYLGEMDNGLAGTWFTPSDTNTSADVCPYNDLNCLLDINIYVMSGQLYIQINYKEDDFSVNTIQLWMNKIQNKLTEISLIRSVVSDPIVDLTEHKLNQEDLDALFS